MRKFLKVFFGTLLILILILIVGLIIVIQRPSLILRPKWVNPIAAKEGVHFEELHISSRGNGFLEPSVHVSWSRLDAEMPFAKLHAGAGEFNVSLSFRRVLPRVTVIGPITLSADRLEIPEQPKNKTPSSPSKSSSSGLPSWLASACLEKIDIEIDHWKASGDEGSLKLLRPKASEKWNLQATEANHRLSVQMSAENSGKTMEGPWRAELEAKTQSLEIRHCKIGLEKTALNVNCPGEISGELPHIPQANRLKWAKKIPLLFSGRITSSDIYNLSKQAQIDAALKLLTLNPLPDYRDLVQTWGQVRFTGSGIPSEPPSRWNFKSQLDLEAQIARFQILVQELKPTLYAVPAPFQSLKGAVHLSVTGNLTPTEATLPIRLVTRLQSKNQHLDIDAAVNARIPDLRQLQGITAQGDVVLTDVQIPLPRLDYGKLPQLLPDTRISEAKPKSHSKAGVAAPLDYEIHIKTTEKPIRILSNLAKEPVPIRTDLFLKANAPMQGTLHVDSFPLDLFHRNAKVDHLDIDFQKKVQRLKGVVQVNYTDYLIRIILSGTVDDPQVSFESEPYLPEQDVISVLLFGRTSEDLDPDQTQSVGSVRSAAASRGLDLASLYFLASTPVESVGYDPQSGTFSAKFRIAEGTSLTVAEAQYQLQAIGLRKRIGSHWAVTTQYGNPADPTDKSVSTLLEWSHRY